MSATTATLALLNALVRPSDQRQPTRVGLLNTGELVMVDATGGAQVLSAATTNLIREQLIHTEFADSELLLFPPGGGLGSEPVRAGGND